MRHTLTVILFFLTTAFPTRGIDFFEDFESGTLDSAHFTTTTSDPVNGVAQVVDVIAGISAGHNSRFGVALGRLTDAESFEETINTLDLALDLSGERDVELSFWVKDNFNETTPAGGILLSDDGGATFVRAYGFDTELWSLWSNTYGLISRIDLDQLASAVGLNLTATFVIRFQQEGRQDFTGGVVFANGIFLDDIRVQSHDLAVEYAQLPFVADFENGEMPAAMAQAHPLATTLPERITPDSLVAVADRVQFIPVARSGRFGLAMGRRLDNDESIETTVSAVDLHLNLRRETEPVTMRLWIKNNQESSDDSAGDALFFSDDGGRRFTLVADLNYADFPEDTFSELVINVNELSAAFGLSLSDRFIIRIQQEGDDDFSGPSFLADGIFIDDITVEAGGPPGSDTCTSTSTALCLVEGRFRVELAWRTPDGNSGQAMGDFLSEDTGYFYFFTKNNVEAVVKVLDGCGINGTFWVFLAGLTNVQVDITITDTVTGQVRTWRNPQGTLFQPVGDTQAFPCS